MCDPRRTPRQYGVYCRRAVSSIPIVAARPTAETGKSEDGRGGGCRQKGGGEGRQALRVLPAAQHRHPPPSVAGRSRPRLPSGVERNVLSSRAQRRAPAGGWGCDAAAAGGPRPPRPPHLQVFVTRSAGMRPRRRAQQGSPAGGSPQATASPPPPPARHAPRARPAAASSSDRHANAAFTSAATLSMSRSRRRWKGRGMPSSSAAVRPPAATTNAPLRGLLAFTTTS